MLSNFSCSYPCGWFCNNGKFKCKIMGHYSFLLSMIYGKCVFSIFFFIIVSINFFSLLIFQVNLVLVSLCHIFHRKTFFHRKMNANSRQVGMFSWISHLSPPVTSVGIKRLGALLSYFGSFLCYMSLGGVDSPRK